MNTIIIIQKDINLPIHFPTKCAISSWFFLLAYSQNYHNIIWVPCAPQSAHSVCKQIVFVCVHMFSHVSCIKQNPVIDMHFVCIRALVIALVCLQWWIPSTDHAHDQATGLVPSGIFSSYQDSIGRHDNRPTFTPANALTRVPASMYVQLYNYQRWHKLKWPLQQQLLYVCM